MEISHLRPAVTVSGGFDDIRSRQVRFLQEASRLGELQVALYSDEILFSLNGKAPKLSAAERLYFIQSLRYVKRAAVIETLADLDTIPGWDRLQSPATWAVEQEQDNPAKQAFCAARGLGYAVIRANDLAGFPLEENEAAHFPAHKKVLVTGSFDWLHSGHVRFFEEASELGDLTVVVGHDANIKLLKGEGHPLFPEDERRYMVQSVRFVKQALISSGHGWMDAEPEIARVHPDYYVVNEDGDKPEKRFFCQEHGIEYRVLKRQPKPGLPRRASTSLRGF